MHDEKQGNHPALLQYLINCNSVLLLSAELVSLVCFSFFFWLRVLDKAEYSAFKSTLNSSIVSYRN